LSDLDAIEAFLVARNGIESFDWTPPTGAAGKWICTSWNRSYSAQNVNSLSATFTEVFGE
jgi:phage-related protein